MSDDDNVIPMRRRGGEQILPPPPPSLEKRDALLLLLARYGRHGMTWAEAAAELGLHHGAASALLSRMHAQGIVARLTHGPRNGNKVYVLPDYVAERGVESRRQPVSSLTRDLAEMLRRYHRPCKHSIHLAPHPTCRACETRVLLEQYDALMRRNGG